MDGVKAPDAPTDDWVAEPDGAPFDTSAWNERSAALYAHWRKIRPMPALLPGRRHFDPVTLPRLLGSIWLLDVFHKPFRMKYRLMGTNVAATIGADFTGRWFDEARPTILTVAPAYRRFSYMAKTGRATWRRGRPLLTVDPYWHTTETAMLPMADDGARVDMLLCISIYYGHDGRVR
ncbi:MAG: PAS domain-containing protein [Proteobacteria bacterium]|nr:PAS domain-containing protein [Pseudomonadota bacterium]